MPEGPIDPLTTMAGGMAAMHEMLISAVAAGFTRDEALKMVIAIMLEGMRQEKCDGES